HPLPLCPSPPRRSSDLAAGTGALMATLVVHAAGAAPSFVPLIKPLTTLAAAPDSDVRVPELRGVVAIEFDGESFTVTALEGAQLDRKSTRLNSSHGSIS